MNFVKLKILVI